MDDVLETGFRRGTVGGKYDSVSFFLLPFVCFGGGPLVFNVKVASRAAFRAQSTAGKRALGTRTVLRALTDSP